MRSVPLSVAVLAVAVVLAFMLSPALGRWLRAPRPVAALLIFGFGFVLAATLTPNIVSLHGHVHDGTCDLARMGFPAIESLMRVNSTSLNVLLFVPLGLAIGLLPRRRATAGIAIVAISLTFVIEATQLVVTPLMRGCQSADVFDNLLGLFVGVIIGLLARPLVARLLPQAAS